MTIRNTSAAIMAATLVAGVGAAAASAAADKPAAVLMPLRENDGNPYIKELPGENIGDGGGFSIGSKRYIRLEGRHLTFRSATGVKTCVVSPAAAKSWTFDSVGTLGCGDVRMTIAVNNRVKSDDGQPVIITVKQGAKVSKLSGLWQGLE